MEKVTVFLIVRLLRLKTSSISPRLQQQETMDEINSSSDFKGGII